MVTVQLRYLRITLLNVIAGFAPTVFQKLEIATRRRVGG
jgi:hypothetical protein